jgi:hypothetical protein
MVNVGKVVDVKESSSLITLQEVNGKISIAV